MDFETVDKGTPPTTTQTQAYQSKVIKKVTFFRRDAIIINEESKLD